MTNEQMVRAARATVDWAKEYGYDNSESDIKELDHEHIVSMLKQMEANKLEWSEGKMGRWLGWLQAACTYGTQGQLSLDECKRINLKAIP